MTEKIYVTCCNADCERRFIPTIRQRAAKHKRNQNIYCSEECRRYADMKRAGKNPTPMKKKAVNPERNVKNITARYTHWDAVHPA